MNNFTAALRETTKLVKRIREDKFFTVCASCASEIDLRDMRHFVKDNFFVHDECPPIIPKYT